jgi:hypothetical protein
MSENKLDIVTAEKDFNRFMEEWEIDDSVEGEDKETFVQLKDRIIKNICSGHATVNDNCHIHYNIKHPSGDLTELIFKVPRSSAYVAMDKVKGEKNIVKMNAFLGDMTGQSPAFFANMDGRDYKFCQAVVSLFLAG